MFFLCGMKNSMKEQIILILIFLLESNCVEAQWEKKDSLWLQDVLSGKEKLKLNPETMQAIKSGTFIKPICALPHRCVYLSSVLSDAVSSINTSSALPARTSFSTEKSPELSRPAFIARPTAL